jgi:hypothetical protein
MTLAAQFAGGARRPRRLPKQGRPPPYFFVPRKLLLVWGQVLIDKSRRHVSPSKRKVRS